MSQTWQSKWTGGLTVLTGLGSFECFITKICRVDDIMASSFALETEASARCTDIIAAPVPAFRPLPIKRPPGAQYWKQGQSIPPINFTVDYAQNLPGKNTGFLLTFSHSYLIFSSSPSTCIPSRHNLHILHCALRYPICLTLTLLSASSCFLLLVAQFQIPLQLRSLSCDHFRKL